MKLCYLANIRFPSERAHSSQIAQMCQAFSDLCEEVDLVVDSRVVGGKSEVDQFYKIDSRFKIHRLPGVFSVSSKFLYFLGTVRFVINFIFRKDIRQYDVIFSRNELMLFFLFPLVKKKVLIWESHSRSENYFSRFLLRKGVRCVVTAVALRNLYEKTAQTNSQVLVAPNGVSENFFDEDISKSLVRDRLSLKSDSWIAMYIGGLDGWKGVETFLESSSYIDGVSFVVIGGGLDEIKTLKNRYPLVIFLGQRPYSELSENQRAADVLIVPNTANNQLSNEYTSPLKLFAHMASGIPIVASNIPSITSIDGSDYLNLFDADNPGDLAHVINSVCSNYDDKLIKAQKLADLSRGFTWENRAKKILNINPC